MKKTFVVDTGVLTDAPECIEVLGSDENIVVLPGHVLKELNAGKKSSGLDGMQCRAAARRLEEYSKKGELHKGVTLDGGGTLIVDFRKITFKNLLPGVEREKDTKLISLAKILHDEGSSNVWVISEDINLRTLARLHGLTAEPYKNSNPASKPELMRTGNITIDITEIYPEILQEYEVFKNGGGYIPQIKLSGAQNMDKLHPNACCVLKVGETQLQTIFDSSLKSFKYISKHNPNKNVVMPRNPDQWFAYELLKRPEITIRALVGKAGTGKTLMAIAAGCEQVFAGTYDKMVVYRATHPLGKDLGYLKGSLDEKMRPWTTPVYDCMDLISGMGANEGNVRMTDKMIGDGILELDPITFAQGCTHRKSYVIVDEAQNLDPEQMKAIISRIGEGSVIVLSGDPWQCVNRDVDIYTNGLVHAVRRLVGNPLFGTTQLTIGERSATAELAAMLL